MRFGGYGITQAYTEPIAFERRCTDCGLLLAANATSPCCAPVAKKQRGATKATLAYRAKMLGVCPDCGMLKSICREVGGCQPSLVSRGQMLSAVLKVAP